MQPHFFQDFISLLEVEFHFGPPYFMVCLFLCCLFMFSDLSLLTGLKCRIKCILCLFVIVAVVIPIGVWHSDHQVQRGLRYLRDNTHDGVIQSVVFAELPEKSFRNIVPVTTQAKTYREALTTSFGFWMIDGQRHPLRLLSWERKQRSIWAFVEVVTPQVDSAHKTIYKLDMVPVLWQMGVVQNKVDAENKRHRKTETAFETAQSEFEHIQVSPP